MPIQKPATLDELARYPRMTRWFGLMLLIKLAWRVAIAELFGRFADGRLMVAALDKSTEADLAAAASAHLPGGPDEAFTLDDDGALWIDFVADLGDGFDATFAIASLMARETLAVGEHATRRGRLLVMGGDEVYPLASPENYQQRLRDPYDWAFPDPDPESDSGPLVYAIPGNHDWYDGLVLFLGLFTRRDRLHLGGWRSRQGRSYFALQLTGDWWLWAVDAQLDNTIDQPQRDYFSAIAEAMEPDAHVILCGPEPGWLYTRDPDSKSLDVYDLIGDILRAKCPMAQIPLVLSGDTHHYSRYIGATSGVQFVTAGGGGGFLEATHHLKDEIAINRGDPNVELGWSADKKLLHAYDETTGRPAAWPSRAESLAMLRGVLAFAVLNPGFAAALGCVYALFGLIALGIGHLSAAVVALIVATASFQDYTRRQEGSRARVKLLSLLNGAAHSLAFVGLVEIFLYYAPLAPNEAITNAAMLLAWLALAGGAVAGTLFGVYLYISSRWLDIGHVDAFSAMRRDSHRHFLRLRIKGDEVTVYPIGLARTPRRNEWRGNPAPSPAEPSTFVADPPLEAQLIETPFVARATVPP
ncbi:MAG: metallophosphoesterase [Methylobacteriaceae bacterium]|nr:metallophosphoesterase [Methylobacteriaceae bacterium]